MQVGTSPKWLYSIGSHQETHVFWLHYNFGYSLVILQEKTWKPIVTGCRNCFFTPEAPWSSNFYLHLSYVSPPKGRWTIPIWFAVGYAPKLCMSPQVVYGTHSPELPEASPRNGGTGSFTIPVGVYKWKKLSLEKGKKNMFEQTEAGYGDYSFFPVFLLNYVCLFAKWEFCCFFHFRQGL